jgi:hypothetical protein
MKLHIEAESTVKDVQEQFHSVYPYLQIHFYKEHTSDSSNLKRQEKVSPGFLFKHLTVADKPFSVSIDQNTTVAELLENFGGMGLVAEVCRKCGKHWVPTSLTADWTLQRQTNEAILINVKDHESPKHNSGSGGFRTSFFYSNFCSGL